MKSTEEKSNTHQSAHESEGFGSHEQAGTGLSMAAPPFNLTTSSSPVQRMPAPNTGVVQRRGFWDSVGDFLGTRENEADLDLQEDIADFKSRNYGPITYKRPNISGSGFEASYFPNQDRLHALVRAKVRFADGIVVNGNTVTSPNHFMNQGRLMSVLSMFPDLRTQVLPYFQWGADEREICKMRFLDNIEGTTRLWEDTGMSFQVNQPGWEGVVARPDVDIQVSEGEAVTQRTNWGPFGIFTSVDEQGSDHLQIEVVKQLTPADAATVNTLISNYINNLAPLMPGLFGGLIPPAGDAQGVRSYLGNDRGSRGSNPQGHNNFMSLESDRSDDPNRHVFEHVVFFENDNGEISPSEQAKLDTFFSNPMVLLQNPNGTVRVRLKGFASAEGSTAHNRSVVEQRLQTVSAAINGKMGASRLNIQTQIDPSLQHNDADAAAETARSTDPAYNAADHRRVEIRIVQPGRGAGQNVLAHEMGHVFGLGDEYAEVGNGYNRPAGALADHDQLAKDAGVPAGAVVGTDNRMMSAGNTVGQAHYSTFADALRKLTSKPWKIV